FVHAHKAHALGGPAGLTDLSGFEPNDLAFFRDDHQVGILFYRKDSDYLANLRRCFHVDDALAPSRRQPIVLKRSTLAEPVLGDGKNQSFLLHYLETDEIIAFLQVHGANTTSLTAHGPDLIFGKPDRHALMGAEKNEIVSVGNRCAKQFIAVIQS